MGPSPKRLRMPAVRRTCVATQRTPTDASNAPKKAASASLVTSACCARALNCHPATAVTNEESTTIPAIALRWADPSTSRRLSRSPWLERGAGAWPTTAAGRRDQRARTGTVASRRSAAMRTRRLSAPNRRASALERTPPAVAPRVAPAPTKPKSRRASRGVRT